MARLVSPGYEHSALINSILPPNAERIIEFQGLNKRSVIAEGEMSDMRNLSTDGYPLLKPRKPRGRMEIPDGILRPLHIINRFDKIGIIAIDEPDPEEEDPETVVSFYYDGVKVEDVVETGSIPGLSTATEAVAINNKLCFFPEKTCIDITNSGVQEGTYRSLEASYEVPLAGVSVTITATDTSFAVPKDLFEKDDVISIKGTLSYTPPGGSATSMTLTLDSYYPIQSIDKATGVQTTDTIHIGANAFLPASGTANLVQETMLTRTMPDLDMVVEWNNRLWGCSSSENMIYASKLGDPTNWQYYQGTSLDSYYAQQGTDEIWTGIAEYSGHLIFFKPNSMTRVYGTSPSNFQVTSTKCYGVEPGSRRSVLTINDTVFYKSSVGIMAYQGGTPFCISDKIPWRMKNVVAGTEGRKYYCSVVRCDGMTENYILVFDIAKGMWHLEDNARFTDSCNVGDRIYIAVAEPSLTCDPDIFCNTDIFCESESYIGEVDIINPVQIVETHTDAVIIDPDDPPENYEDIEWMAVFGPFDEYIEEHKIYSKLAMRLIAKGDASCNVYINLNEAADENGDLIWEQVEHYDRVSTKGDFIPIIPRRCDRYSVKIEGKGNFEVKSLTRRVRQGTFGRL